MKANQTTTHPEQYLHVEDCRSGQTWIVPFGEHEPMDLRTNLETWAKRQFSGELELDGELMPELQGDYYSAIYTDGRSPEGCVVWQSGGFYLRAIQ